VEENTDIDECCLDVLASRSILDDDDEDNVGVMMKVEEWC